MGPEGIGFQGWWIIPIIFCVLMFLFMFFGRGQRGFGPNRFFDRDENNVKDSSESALEILNKRYAKGEISKIEYDEMKSNLMK
jgi:putative membrane protein